MIRKGELSVEDLENIETRASSAYRELQKASLQYVIPNQNDEDSDHWETFYHPIGEARLSLQAIVAILAGAVPTCAEHWEEDLLPSDA